MIRMRVVFYACMWLAAAACGPSPSGQSGEAVYAGEAKLSEAERGFMDNLTRLCGKSFRGREVYTAPGRESWAEKDLVMHVELCESDRVHIPFHVDDDTSRTWMFLVEDGRLRFRHDHRHPDGTPDETTLYGGYADGNGTAFAQFFPADQYTIELLVDTLNRQWHIVLDENLQSFSYELHYLGKLVFRADFDLSNPISEP